MSQPAISAIVVTYQTGPHLKECLYALVADPDIDEIIIVNNGNPEQMLNWLQGFASQHEGAQLISGHGNIGFGAGVNLGVCEAAGPHILVINPDAVLRRDSLPGMQAVAGSLASPWIVGGKIYDIRGREERGGRRRELTLWRAVMSLLGLNTWTLEMTPPPREPVDMPAISGAFFLTSKGSLAVLNGFDEGYFLHVEDVDLCRRCWDAGGIVKYDPRAGALHYGSTAEAPSRIVAKHKADSLERYFRRFSKGPFERLLITLAMPIMRFGLALRAR
ncbi:MAG: glycosyltransferase family 2 protein [Pseudomonadota bacterium]